MKEREEVRFLFISTIRNDEPVFVSRDPIGQMNEVVIRAEKEAMQGLNNTDSHLAKLNRLMLLLNAQATSNGDNSEPLVQTIPQEDRWATWASSILECLVLHILVYHCLSCPQGLSQLHYPRFVECLVHRHGIANNIQQGYLFTVNKM